MNKEHPGRIFEPTPALLEVRVGTAAAAHTMGVSSPVSGDDTAWMHYDSKGARRRTFAGEVLTSVARGSGF